MPEDQNTLLDASQPGLRDNINIGGQAGLATYVAAKLFGTTPLPPDMPDWLKDSIESQANFAQRLPGADAITIGGAGGGPLDARTKKERQHDATEASIEYLSVVAEHAEQERERQHEMQWLSESHSYAGQTLTGTEWHEMKTWFGDARNAEAWEDTMVAETGESRAEVRRTGGKMKRFYDLMDKDAKGTLTKAEKDEFTTIRNDTQVKRGIEVQRQMEDMRADHGIVRREGTDARLSGPQEESLAQRSDLYADAAPTAKGLAAAEPLSPIYRKAVDAIPAPTQATALQAAAPVAANTIIVSPANLFG